ncbi:hypothetical protein D6C99_09615 [Aureobasidium pullulans]|nr:hypothetical protein D6D29_10195 [Aureobasidium pullulans]THY37535.1 hypothetical protein D6C99_09615 [Aureobasidium pullulans]
MGSGGVLWKCVIRDSADALAYGTSTDTPVAVKVAVFKRPKSLPEESLQSAGREPTSEAPTDDSDKWYHEVQMMKRLSQHRNCPYIVRLLGTTVTTMTGGLLRTNICMEWFPHDMSNFLKLSTSPPTQKDIALFARQICLGLDYIHHEDIVHCDIKPDNLLINQQGNLVKIADFGSAFPLALGTTQTYDCFAGTPHYQAPEILLKEDECGHAVDLWALGCVVAYLAISTNQLWINAEALNAQPGIQGSLPYSERSTHRSIQMLSIVAVLGLQSENFEQDNFFSAENVTQIMDEECVVPDKLITMAMRGSFARAAEFRKLVTDEIGSSGFDFVSKCLQLRSEKRFSAAEAMKHEYLRG